MQRRSANRNKAAILKGTYTHIKNLFNAFSSNLMRKMHTAQMLGTRESVDRTDMISVLGLNTNRPMTFFPQALSVAFRLKPSRTRNGHNQQHGTNQLTSNADNLPITISTYFYAASELITCRFMANF